MIPKWCQWKDEQWGESNRIAPCVIHLKRDRAGIVTVCGEQNVLFNNIYIDLLMPLLLSSSLLFLLLLPLKIDRKRCSYKINKLYE